jgi:high-affinity nickel-transport protein
MTISLAAVLLLGFFLGMRHATDADHVIAVSTIVTRERSLRYAALIGGIWGAGHTLTICIVGAAIILFKMAIPPSLGLTMEFCVALMLILLGLWNITGFSSSVDNIVRHSHSHSIHGQSVVGHEHGEGENRALAVFDRLLGNLSFYQLSRPLLIGIVHGLAGSAAVALLVLTTLQNTKWAIAYLLIFGVGTIAGMMVITVALASAISYSHTKSSWLGAKLGAIAGYVSLVFGLVVAYQIGIVDGLFSHSPHWTPH